MEVRNEDIGGIGLEALLDRHVASDARSGLPYARALDVTLRSVIVEREPIYRQQETVEVLTLDYILCLVKLGPHRALTAKPVRNAPRNRPETRPPMREK